MTSKFQTMAAIAALLGTAVAAQAADLPEPGLAPIYKAAPMPMGFAYNWTGFYAGVNAGYAWARVTEDVVFPGGGRARLGSEDMHGFNGGTQAGYNLQIGRFVYGLETDFQGSDQKNKSSAFCTVGVCGFAGPVSIADKIQWFGTTRGRIGYAVDRVMFYVTGGLSYMNFKSDASVAGIAVSGSATSIGYAAGGGVEAAVWGNWTAKAEYLYLDAAKMTATVNVAPIGRVSDEIHLRNSVVRAGVNYRF